MKKNKNVKFRANVKYKTYSAVMTAGLIIALFLFNYLISVLDGRFNLSIDMSAQRLYSLSSTSKEIISALKEDIYIYTTESDGIEDTNTQELLKNYDAQSPKIHLENIDIIKNPAAMDCYDSRAGEVIDAGAIIVSSSSDTNAEGQRYEIISYDDIYSYNEETEEYDEFTAESAITGAIKYVVNPVNQKIWLLDNHSADVSANSAIKETLEDENYHVEMLSILNGENPLSAGDIVIIMSPESDLTPAERDILDKFSDEGGRMLIGIDQTINETEDIANLLSLIEKYNIKTGQGIVKETDNSRIAVMGGNDLAYIIPDILQHEITENLLSGSYKVVLGTNPGYLILQEKINDAQLTANAVLMTSETSYVQQWGAGIGEHSDSESTFGEYAVMAALTKSAEAEGNKDTKIIITTAPSMFTDTEIMDSGVYKNRELLAGCVSWLGDDEAGIYISAKPLTASPLMIETMKQAYIIIASVSVVIPLIIYLMGIIVFVRRNNL